jgi:hypothetical protein
MRFPGKEIASSHKSHNLSALQRINAPANAPYPKEIAIDPQFIVRVSTAPVF